MATYLELRRQAEKLMAEAEQLRQKEIDDAIADIKAKMEMYGLTVDDLGARRGRPAGKKSTKTASKAKSVKYRGPNGETWSGGRGRRPEWVQKLLKSGKKLEDYAV